jgi:hypothetical protein
MIHVVWYCLQIGVKIWGSFTMILFPLQSFEHYLLIPPHSRLCTCQVILYDLELGF